MSLISISGPSGAGKTTLMYGIINILKANLLPSWTTRRIRNNSTTEDIYKHISIEEYHVKLKEGYFLLSEQIAGNFYGTSASDLNIALDSPDIWFIDFTAKSVIELISLGYSPKLCIVLEVNKELSQKRMELRGDNANDIKARMSRYDEEIYYCNALRKIHPQSVLINGDDSSLHIKINTIEIVSNYL